MLGIKSISFYALCHYNFMKLHDVLFAVYIVIILPLASLFYFAIALTNFDTLLTIAGAAILWGVMIPYPVYRYVKIKFS